MSQLELHFNAKRARNFIGIQTFAPSAAITGAGGGLGRDIALGLAAKGYIVFGTAISAAEVQDLKEPPAAASA